jgi:hypothetical protein
MGVYEDLAEREGYLFEARRQEAEARDLERRARAFDAAVKAIGLLEAGSQGSLSQAVVDDPQGHSPQNLAPTRQE